MRLKNKKNGFTLLECLVSMLLLAVISTGGMALYFYVDEIQAIVMHKKYITEYLNRYLENFKISPYSGISAGSFQGTIGQGISGLTEVNVTLVDGDDPPDGINDFKEVEVAFSWVETGEKRNRKIALSTYIEP